MAKFIKFELNRSGVRDLLRSPAVAQACLSQAEAIRSRIPADGYSTDTHTGRNRANASVLAKTKEAKRDNLENNSLLKALR